MATTANDTTARELVDPALPLAHRANTDAPGHWEARVAELEALRDAYVAEGRPVAEAAELAIRHLDSRLEAEAGAVTFLITAWAAWTSGSERRKAAQRRDPRTPRMRAADKARFNLATGARVVFDGAAALVSSASRTGVVHRVEGGCCTCEAGQQSRPCWHLEAARQERRSRRARRLERIAAVMSTLRAGRLAAA